MEKGTWHSHDFSKIPGQDKYILVSRSFTIFHVVLWFLYTLWIKSEHKNCIFYYDTKMFHDSYFIFVICACVKYNTNTTYHTKHLSNLSFAMTMKWQTNIQIFLGVFLCFSNVSFKYSFYNAHLEQWEKKQRKKLRLLPVLI